MDIYPDWWRWWTWMIYVPILAAEVWALWRFLNRHEQDIVDWLDRIASRAGTSE